MRKGLLLLLWLCCLLPTYGCAVAVTANVRMPQTHAVAETVQPLSAGAVKTAEAVVDVTTDVTARAAAGTETDALPTQPEASFIPDAPAMLEPIVQQDVQQDAPAAETPAVTAAPTPKNETEETPAQEPTPSPTPEKTPKATPKATPEPTQEPTPEPMPAYTVEEIMPETGYVYAKSVNLRESPNTDCRVLAEYEKGEPLTITGKSGDWYRVEVRDGWGFMRKDYVRMGTAAEPTPEPTSEPAPKPTETPKPTPEPTPEPAPVSVPMPAASLSDELYLAAQLVDEEAGADGFLAVANVIFNRVQDSRFPNTITGVVFQSGQFTPADEETALRSVTPSAGALAAVQQIFVDGNCILPPEIVYFRAASRGTAWGKRTYYATIGGNAFYS